jgi:hypothetical protein
MVTEQQPVPGPNGAPPPAAGQGRSPVAARMDARASLRAALEKGEDAAPAAAAEEPAQDAPAGQSDAGEAVEAAKPDAAKPTAEKVDPETEKRLAKVQDAEKRSREKLAAERKEFEAERAKAAEERKALDAQRAEFEQFQKLRERAKVDPVAAMKALGIDDLEYAAKQAYAATKADPNNKEAAARALREREAADKISATEKRIMDLEKKLEEREQRAMVQRQAEEYMSGVMKAADANPLAKHVMAKDPDHANQRLRRIAYDLAQELDDVPDAEDVIARFEQEERQTLTRYGVNIDSILKPDTTKKNEPTAEKKNAAPTLSHDLTTSRVARARETEREKRDAVRAALESGKLD